MKFLPLVLILPFLFFMSCEGSDDPDPDPDPPISEPDLTLTGTVTIRDTVSVSQTITANTGSLGGSGKISYEWKISDSDNGPFTNIDNATKASYTAETDDADKYIRVEVTRAGYTGSVPSNNCRVIFDPNHNDTPPDFSRTAFEYFQEEEIFAGWNMGNTFDSWSSVAGVPTGGTGWGTNTIPTQTTMNGIKNAGYDLIRIPVTWMGWFNEEGENSIYNRLKVVQSAVDRAHTAGLKVIINLHHDGASNSATSHQWLSIKDAYDNEETKTAITGQFVWLWEHIAGHFKNYNDWLMFEGFNEIHDGGWGWGQMGTAGEYRTGQLAILNEWNQAFVDTVRATGGNNEYRLLVVPGYCQKPHLSFPPDYKLPEDSVPDRLIFSFHYYDPERVGLGSSSAQTNDQKSDWGTEANKNAIDTAFQRFANTYTGVNATASVSNPVPVIIGECGATRQFYASSDTEDAGIAGMYNPENFTTRTEIARAARLAYLEHLYATGKKYGLVPVYWDNGVPGNESGIIKRETFGLFNRSTGKPHNYPETDEFAGCIEAMIRAVKPDYQFNWN